MKKLIYILVLVLMVNMAFAYKLMPIYIKPSPKQASTTLSYEFNFSNYENCTVAATSIKKSITTDGDGIGFAMLNLSNLTDMTRYMCEYRSGSLRKVHTMPDNLLKSIRADSVNTTSIYINNTDIGVLYPTFSYLFNQGFYNNDLNISSLGYTKNNTDVKFRLINGTADSLMLGYGNITGVPSFALESYADTRIINNNTDAKSYADTRITNNKTEIQSYADTRIVNNVTGTDSDIDNNLTLINTNVNNNYTNLNTRIVNNYTAATGYADTRITNNFSARTDGNCSVANSCPNIAYEAELGDYVNSTNVVKNSTDSLLSYLRTTSINTSKIYSADWTNISITKSQITDLGTPSTEAYTDTRIENNITGLNSDIINNGTEDRSYADTRITNNITGTDSDITNNRTAIETFLNTRIDNNKTKSDSDILNNMTNVVKNSTDSLLSYLRTTTINTSNIYSADWTNISITKSQITDLGSPSTEAYTDTRITNNVTGTDSDILNNMTNVVKNSTDSLLSYIRGTKLNISTGTDNILSLGWGNITSIPAGFADGVDNTGGSEFNKTDLNINNINISGRINSTGLFFMNGYSGGDGYWFANETGGVHLAIDDSKVGIGDDISSITNMLDVWGGVTIGYNHNNDLLRAPVNGLLVEGIINVSGIGSLMSLGYGNLTGVPTFTTESYADTRITSNVTGTDSDITNNRTAIESFLGTRVDNNITKIDTRINANTTKLDAAIVANVSNRLTNGTSSTFTGVNSTFGNITQLTVVNLTLVNQSGFGLNCWNNGSHICCGKC